MAAALAAASPLFAAPASIALKPPAGLDKLRKIFAAAVAAKDIPGIARLSHFPVAVDVYGSKPQLTEREFTRDKQHFDGWFGGGDAGLVTCLASQPLAMHSGKDFGAGSWVIDCNGNEYYFAPGAGRWSFVAYQNINE
jgi:hypothetical protein